MMLRSLSNAAIGCALRRDNEPAIFGFFSVERPFLLALVAGIVGEPMGALPPDRDLTYVERSLIEYAIPALLTPLIAAWPGDHALHLSVASAGPPKATCQLPLDEPAIEMTLNAMGDLGDCRAVLVLQPFGPLGATDESSHRSSPQQFDRAHTEAVIREMPISFSVLLGQTKLSLRQLAGIKPGDILILNQRVVEPLVAKVGDRDRFRVSPGAIGQQQAVRIHSVLSATDAGAAGTVKP